MTLDPKLSSLVRGGATPPPSASEYEQLKVKTEQLTQTLAQMKGLQTAKEQEIDKMLQEAGAASPEDFMQKAKEMEDTQTTLLQEWQQRILILEPKVSEVNREFHL